MEATAEQALAFGAALLRQLEGKDRAQFMADVAVAAGETVSRGALQQWLAGGTEPTRAKVFAIEHVLGVRPGTLSRHLGYLPVDAVTPKSVAQAIDEDSRLTEQGRRILKANYRELTRG